MIQAGHSGSHLLFHTLEVVTGDQEFRASSRLHETLSKKIKFRGKKEKLKTPKKLGMDLQDLSQTRSQPRPKLLMGDGLSSRHKQEVAQI